METISLPENIHVFYVAAASFPEGIREAHEKLHALVPFTKERRYFGISRPEGGNIAYKAAAEELYAGEAARLNCSTVVLKKGNYISITVHDYLADVMTIDQAFKQLLTHPHLDQEGYCIEWYLNNKDVQCMIRLDN